MVIKYLINIFLSKFNKSRPLTITPLLNINLLFSSLVKSKKNNQNKLAISFTNKESIFYWLSKSTWSIALIAKWSSSIEKTKKINIFIPEYFCNMSLNELRETGINIIFYKLNDDLLPDLQSVNNKLDSNSSNLFLFVHYFGNILDIVPTSKFCKENQILLIEDAVHLLRPEINVGNFSDFTLYSPYKHLPIPNGALIAINTNGPSFKTHVYKYLKIFEEEYENLINSYRNNNFEITLWLFKRLLQNFGFRRKYISSFEHEGSTIKSYNPRISNLSLVILEKLIPRFDFFINIKLKNAHAWEKILTSTLNIKFSKNKSEIPYLLGYNFDKSIIHYYFNFFQNLGIPVATWPDLPPEVYKNQTYFKLSINLRNSRIYFPVHQSITTTTINLYYKPFINLFSSKWKMKEINKEDWNYYYGLINKNNLLQSLEYVQTKEECDHWISYMFLITDSDNVPISIVNILKKKLPFIGDYIRINRGPLLIDKDSKSNTDIFTFGSLHLITKEANSRNWKFIFIAPELLNNYENVSNLKLLGFIPRKLNPWASGLISLNHTEQELLMNLNGKWRNTLKKGLKYDLNIRIESENHININSLLEKYNKLKQHNKFDGLTDNFIHKLSSKRGEHWLFNLFTAFEIHDVNLINPIGILVSVKSGDTTIYLIGTTDDLGRKLQANSVLLWSAILKAKSDGSKYFDIGGLNKDTPKGIAEFKSGLNSEKYELIGEWIWQKYLN
jgi:lipid II:glycine glycyltransferase (peptidoglycan interpeptide bridge formation enzyme)/dTDP-4-amino-4,6-dideoxygalactose transaminase